MPTRNEAYHRARLASEKILEAMLKDAEPAVNAHAAADHRRRRKVAPGAFQRRQSRP